MKTEKLEVEEKLLDEEPADFEKAITATGWGKFNIIIYVISITSGWSSIFEASTMSYVFPAAECDLQLELGHKGLLNAVTYAGMISSGVIWGYLCDTLGRKKLLIAGFFLDAIFVLISATSQSFAQLMTAKFLGGFIINGPFAALTSYLSEFHCKNHRARVQMVLGIIFSGGSLMLPILALGILPLNIEWWLNEYFVLHSWNLYLFVCALPATISMVAFCFLPESPKFLMTIGNNEKAMEIFKRVYRINTGKDESTYPIKQLINETENATKSYKHGGKVTANRTKKQALVEGMQQIKPLFYQPHVLRIILVCFIQLQLMMSLNTLRLWLPQLFQAINDYQYSHNDTASLCEMIGVFQTNKNKTLLEKSIGQENVTVVECFVNHDNSQVYTNAIIVAGVSVLGYVVAGSLINILGKKILLGILTVTSGVTALCLYFSQDVATVIVLTSIFIAFGSISVNVMLAVIVDLFPTTLRTLTVSIAMTLGRSGAMMGNLIFPVLLASGCAPPFIFVGSTMLLCFVLALLLPNTDMKSLE